MKPFFILLSTSLLLTFAALSQDASHKVSFYFKKGIKLNAQMDQSLIYCEYKDRLYYTDDLSIRIIKKGNNDSVIAPIYTYDFKSDKVDSFTLLMPRNTQWRLSCIAVNDKYIAIKCDSIYIFDINSKKFIDTINSRGANGIKFVDGNHLFIYSNYDFHPKDDSIKTRLVIYDLYRKTYPAYLRPKFNYIGYTHLVGNYIDQSGNRIAFAQAIPYDIKIFSSPNLELISEIKDSLPNSSEQIKMLDSLQARRDADPEGVKNFIYAVKNVDSITRIEKILFLSYDTLLVTKKIPKSGFEKRLIDVWVYDKRHTNWRCIVRDQLYITETNSNYTVSQESIPFNFTFSSQIITQGCLLFQAGEFVPPKLGFSNQEYKKYKDEYYSTHDLNQFLWIYSWHIK